MPPARKVVSEAKRVTTTKIALDSEIGLLSIGVNKILALRISEWLKTQGKKC